MPKTHQHKPFWVVYRRVDMEVMCITSDPRIAQAQRDNLHNHYKVVRYEAAEEKDPNHE